MVMMIVVMVQMNLDVLLIHQEVLVDTMSGNAQAEISAHQNLFSVTGKMIVRTIAMKGDVVSIQVILYSYSFNKK